PRLRRRHGRHAVRDARDARTRVPRPGRRHLHGRRPRAHGGRAHRLLLAPTARLRPVDKDPRRDGRAAGIHPPNRRRDRPRGRRSMRIMTEAIRTDALVKTFGRTRALDGLDLAVETGEVHGFLGPTGAGKSTTIRVLLGLLRADAG